MNIKIGTIIRVKSALSIDGYFDCKVYRIEKEYIHANLIHPDGTLCCIEIVVPVDSEEIISQL